jgi:hypothetical protein
MFLAAAVAGAIGLCPPGVAHAQTIDRVLAVVEGQIVTLSDVHAALKFGLVPADVATDPIQAALRRVIERRLMLAEVERYAPPEPSQASVDAGVAAIQSRFKDALAFEIALNQSSLPREQMRRYVRDSLRIDAYLQQRFSSAAEPNDEEIARHYQERASEFTVNGVLRPLEEVRERVRTSLVEERRAEAVNQWLQGLWRRGSIVIVPSARG